MVKLNHETTYAREQGLARRERVELKTAPFTGLHGCCLGHTCKLAQSQQQVTGIEHHITPNALPLGKEIAPNGTRLKFHTDFILSPCSEHVKGSWGKTRRIPI